MITIKKLTRHLNKKWGYGHFEAEPVPRYNANGQLIDRSNSSYTHQVLSLIPVLANLTNKETIGYAIAFGEGHGFVNEAQHIFQLSDSKCVTGYRPLHFHWPEPNVNALDCIGRMPVLVVTFAGKWRNYRGRNQLLLLVDRDGWLLTCTPLPSWHDDEVSVRLGPMIYVS